MNVWIRCLGFICTFAYGGYTDYKRREIPNAVPIILFVMGLLSGSILKRFLVLALTLLILLLATKITKQELPGGDLKLICAMTFSVGLVETIMVLALVGIGSVAVGLAKKLPLKRNIPLCAYVAPAYAMLCATNIILQGGL